VYAEPGTSGAFDIDCDNEDAIFAAEMWFTYDSTIGLDVSNVTTASRTEGWTVAFSKDESDPSAVETHILLYNMSGWAIDPGTGAILSVEYDVDAEASGDCPLDVTQVNLSDALGQPLPATWQDGTFECIVGMCSDVAPCPGCNELINMGDVTLLLNHVGYPGRHPLCCEWCGDVAPYDPGCNELINMGDVVLLLNHVGYPGRHPLCCEEVLSATVASAVPAVPAAAQNEVNLVPQDSSAPFCETTDVEIWVDATNSQGGQIKLTYDPTCAEVTDWVSNTVEFPLGTWDSDAPGEEWITFLAQYPMTGTYRIGTLTIHGVSEEGCTTDLDFVEDGPMTSKLFDDGGNEIPATWTATYKAYLPLVMKNYQ